MHVELVKHAELDPSRLGWEGTSSRRWPFLPLLSNTASLSMWAAWAAWEACCGESLTPCGDSLPYSSTTTLHCLHRRCRHHRRLQSIHLDTLTLHAAARSELRLSPPLLAAAPVGGGSNSLSPWACSRNPPAFARPGAAAPAHRCGYGSWCVMCAWPTWCAWCGRICATSVHVCMRMCMPCHAMQVPCHAMPCTLPRCAAVIQAH